MKCLTCKFDNYISAKFCSSCGYKLITDDNLKSLSDISVDWLIEVLQILGYQVEADESKESFMAYSDTKANILIELKSSISSICVTSFWKIRKPSLLSRSKYLNLLNQANKATCLCTYSFGENMNSLHVTGYIFITEKLSNRDISYFLDIFNQSIQYGFDESGLRDIA